MITCLIIARKCETKRLYAALTDNAKNRGYGISFSPRGTLLEIEGVFISENDVYFEPYDPMHAPDSGLFLSTDYTYINGKLPWMPLSARLKLLEEMVEISLQLCEYIELIITCSPVSLECLMPESLTISTFIDTINRGIVRCQGDLSAHYYVKRGTMDSPPASLA